MKVREFTVTLDETGERVARVSCRVASPADPDEQLEWISFQAEIDAPIGQPVSILQARALEKARDILAEIIVDLRRLANREPQ